MVSLLSHYCAYSLLQGGSIILIAKLVLIRYMHFFCYFPLQGRKTESQYSTNSFQTAHFYIFHEF